MISPYPLRLWMALGVLTSGATSAYPQARIGVTEEASRALVALKPAKLVRLHTADGPVVGRLISADRDSLVILEAGERRALPMAGLDSVWTRRGHGVHGALILGAVGLGLGVAYGVAISDQCEAGSNCGAAPVILGGAGMVGGGLIGLGVGSAIHSYALQAPRGNEGAQ